MAWRIDDANDYQHHQLLLSAAKSYQNPNYYAAGNHSLIPWQRQQQQPQQLLLSYMNPNQLPAGSAVLQSQSRHHHDLEAAFARMNLSPGAVNGFSSADMRFQILNSLTRRNDAISDLFPPPNSSPASACPNFYGGGIRSGNRQSQNLTPGWTTSFNSGDVTMINKYNRRSHNYSSLPRSIDNQYNGGGSVIVSVKNKLNNNNNHRPPRQRVRSLESGYNNKNSTTTPPRPAGVGCYTLEEVRERLVELAKAKESSKALQAMWENNSEHGGRELIFVGVKKNLNELMEDQYGNHLVQKIFELCSYDQMAQILGVFSSSKDRFVDTCLSQHGTRAVQKMIEHIQAADQRASLLSTMNNSIIRLCKDQHGQHVIQQCLKCFVGDQSIKYALEQIAQHCLELSMDKSGCCVVQGAVSYAKVYGEAELLDHLCASIISNALILSEHPFGNYVVQYVIELRMETVNGRIVNKLIGNHVGLSMSKYGSNVVEKCLRVCGDKDKAVIVNEIMSSPQFLDFLQDPYGNYVAQTALKRSEGVLQNKLVNMIQDQYPYLHSHLHGKKVLARTRSGNSKHQHQHRAGLNVMNEFPGRRHF